MINRIRVFLNRMVKKLNAAQKIMIGFVVVILAGSFLLILPISNASGESSNYLNALFTATSAVCVTGLVVVNTLNHWSTFGQTVIIILIQIGGLGFMTMVTLLLMVMGKRISLKNRIVIQTSYNLTDVKGMVKLVIFVIKGTLLVEGIGAVILTINFMVKDGYPMSKAMALGAFHSISAFCNAGFDLIGDNSLSRYVGDPVVNLVILSLIVIGGIGFTVWSDLIHLFAHKKEKGLKRFLHMDFKKLKLNSKIALLFTCVFIVSGALFFFFSERNNPGTMGALTTGEKIWASFFQSITLRTAGFFSINQSNLNDSSKLVSILLMIIGGSPGGTSGGIKTVTLGVVVFSVISVIRGKETIEAFGRSISMRLLQKSLTVIFMLFSLIFVSTIILTFTEHHPEFDYDFLSILFETASATATVGISTGLTPYLSVVGKIVIILCMFIGRLGPLTITLALAIKLGKANHIQYPEEKVLVG